MLREGIEGVKQEEGGSEGRLGKVKGNRMVESGEGSETGVSR